MRSEPRSPNRLIDQAVVTTQEKPADTGLPKKRSAKKEHQTAQAKAAVPRVIQGPTFGTTIRHDCEHFSAVIDPSFDLLTTVLPFFQSVPVSNPSFESRCKKSMVHWWWNQITRFSWWFFIEVSIVSRPCKHKLGYRVAESTRCHRSLRHPGPRIVRCGWLGSKPMHVCRLVRGQIVPNSWNRACHISITYDIHIIYQFDFI